MPQIIDFINSYYKIIGIVISVITIFFGYKKLKISLRKDKIDQLDHDNKKPSFYLYLHQGYRLYDKGKKKYKFLLFNLDVSNKSSSKITVTPFIILKVRGIDNKIKISHDKNLFLDKYHSKIEKFDNNIYLDERGKKSGWIISQIPNELIDKRIDYVEVICQDTLGNLSKVEYYLLKDIIYED